ncbi:hypothetical protein SSCS72_02849 [Mammaliicoccus sciuri]|nr:hypothetical protein SSCS72_02849 [Mammaliicoccus sciuri]
MMKKNLYSEDELEELFKYVVKELQSYRQEAKKSQNDVGNDLGISPANLSRIERGKAKTTSFIQILKIVNYYGLDLAVVMQKAMRKYEVDRSFKKES